MQNLSIRWRLTLAYTLTFGSLLTLWAVVFYSVAAARMYRQMDEQLSFRYETLRAALRITDGKVTWLFDRGDPEQYYITARAGFYHQIFDDLGVQLDGSDVATVAPSPLTDASRQAFLTRAPVWETLILRGRFKLRAVNAVIPGPQGRTYLLRVGMFSDEVDSTLRQLAVLLAVLVPLIMAAGGTTGWWLTGRALEPVGQISAAAKRITSANLAERLPLQGTQDELDQLSATLNEMIARLQDSFDQMSQFITNVSHELRTPLAAMRGTSEVALKTAKSEADYRKVLEKNVGELERLAGTVTDLLELARAEAGQLVLRRKSEDLAEMARDAVESFRALAAERNISIRLEADGEVRAEVDPEHVLRLLTNLIDNAIKYNIPGGRIEVSVSAEDAGALITVFNTGKGIAPWDREHIFDRFYRGGRVEGMTGGSGLGLSLARWVVSAHGGRIEVESEPGQGAEFRVWFPRN
jgi:heavy metal sensor kinase